MPSARDPVPAPNGFGADRVDRVLEGSFPMSLSRIGAHAPLGLLGMLALIAGSERLIDRYVVPDTTTLAWHAARRAAAHQVRGCAVLGFGDSLVKHGLATPVLEQSLGVRAYNLALPGGQAAAHEALLRRAIEHGARPSVVLIDGEVLFFSPLQQTRLWAELLPSRELAALAWNVGDWRAATSLAVERGLPALRRRDPIRRQVSLAMAQYRLGALAMEAPVHERNWRVNRGAQLMPILPLDPAALRNIAGGPFASHAANLPYVERFLDRAEAIGATVAWLLPPIHPATQAARDQAGYRETCRAFFEDLQSRHPNLVVLDGQSTPMPHVAMLDLTHLNRDGACRYTAALAEALRPLLERRADAPRWITLTAYPEIAAPAVEDLAESRRMVKLTREAARRGVVATAQAQEPGASR